MKKIIFVLTSLILLAVACPKTFAQDSENIAILAKKGFFDNSQPTVSFSNPCEEVKKTLYNHLKYANSYNYEGLKSLYSDKYTNADGLNKEIYFDLIKKTWESYPDIKYKIDIKNIQIDGNIAIAQVNENASAITSSKSGVVNENGLLQSASESIYYLEKLNNDWLITSDSIIFEKTFLRYGSAKDIEVSLSAPAQIPSSTSYTTSLKMDVPKDSMVIASIGQENITYPQTVAEEVFRKLPENGVLERVFTSNSKNVNEYTVASFGITKAEVSKGTEIKIYVTGLGFVMSRVNVIPKNDYVKVVKNEETK